MFQNLRTTRTSRITAASTAGTETAVNRFAAAPARLVYFQAPTGNAGTVTILGVNGDAPDSSGIVLAAGDTYQTWAEDMSQLAYQFSNPADAVNLSRSY